MLRFKDLAEEFNVPGGQFLVHRELVVTVRNYWRNGEAEPATHQVCQQICTTKVCVRAVSYLYRAIRANILSPLAELKIKWERDLECQINDLDRDRIVAHIPAVSRNARIKLINFYILHRAYLTPGRINKFYATAAEKCPRCGEFGAEMFHMVWSCTSLAGFWEEVIEYINGIILRDILCTPLVCLLGGYTCPKNKKSTTRLTDLGLILAKRELTMHWKSAHGPQIARWRKEIIKWASLENAVLFREIKRGRAKIHRVKVWEHLVNSLLASEADTNSLNSSLSPCR